MATPLKRAPLKYSIPNDSGGNYDDRLDDLMDQFRGISTENLGANVRAKNVGTSMREKEFENVYKDVTNPYAKLEENFKNPYEDLTVNQQQFQFQKRQAMQSQANIMQGLHGAAGGSGIAGLAQAMANQGAIQAQQAAADIGRQERENQLMQAQGQMTIEQMKNARQELKARGEFESSMARAQGEKTAMQMGEQRAMQIGQMQLSAAQANASNALQAAQIRMQGATDARNIEAQKIQGELSFVAGQQQANFENELADKSWGERTFGISW